jgi:hypothetical protein
VSPKLRAYRPINANQSAEIRWKSQSGKRAFEVGTATGRGRTTTSTCRHQYDRLNELKARPEKYGKIPYVDLPHLQAEKIPLGFRKWVCNRK